MGFSSEWEQRYAENTHLSIWPWSDVISLVHRHCRPIITTGGGRVLELGCGAGANISFFRAIGLDYHAVEGSLTIVQKLRQRFPDLAEKIVVGDFTLEQPFRGEFDLVIDRGALTHNNMLSIGGALKKAFDALKLGGIFIGSDWFSTNHIEFSRGEQIDDDYTRTNYTEGPFSGVGKTHFSDESHLRIFFAHFEIVLIEEKLYRRREPRDDYQTAGWNIVARKPRS